MLDFCSTGVVAAPSSVSIPPVFVVLVVAGTVTVVVLPGELLLLELPQPVTTMRSSAPSKPKTVSDLILEA
ncbi:MAG TPA: hypothetical protein VF025_02800 [Gaiellaceae bacterium]